MSSIFKYIYFLWTPQENREEESSATLIIHPDTKSKNTTLNRSIISVNDLINVKLKPVNNIIPAPARNMPPLTKFDLKRLNQAHLKDILSVKLKKTKKRILKRKFPPRHPVLFELLEKTKRL